MIKEAAVAVAVSVVTVGISGCGIWYTRRSDRSAARSAEASEKSAAAAVTSAAAAEKSAAAAERTAALDAERRHAELTPVFEITCTVRENGVGDVGQLRVELAGPDSLDSLDEVILFILDEAGVDHWAHGFPTGMSEEDARGFVWGPWEFNTGAGEQVTGNRTTRTKPYARAEGRNWDRLGIVRTRPGHWMDMDPQQWQREREGPIRLRITCRRGGEEWTLLRDVKPGS